MSEEVGKAVDNAALHGDNLPRISDLAPDDDKLRETLNNCRAAMARHGFTACSNERVVAIIEGLLSRRDEVRTMQKALVEASESARKVLDLMTRVRVEVEALRDGEGGIDREAWCASVIAMLGGEPVAVETEPGVTEVVGA